jgi:pentatricopeptide repeat protein
MVSQVQPTKLASVSADAFEFSQMAMEIFFSMRLELMMFASAVAGYLLLFSSRVPKDMQNLKRKVKLAQKSEDFSEDIEEASPKSFESADASLRRAIDVNNHRAVVKFWNAMKQFDQMPTAHLAKVVEAMRCSKKDVHYIAQEVKSFLQKYPRENAMPLINDILESLAKRLDSQMIGLIVEMLPSLALNPDQCTYEILLNMHATTRSFSEVKRLVSEMSDNQTQLTLGSTLAIVKAALHAGNFEEAYQHFSRIKVSWDAEGQRESSSWPVPSHLMAQFVELACKEHQLQQALSMLKGIPLSEQSFNEMISESISLNDAEMTRAIEGLASVQHSPLPDSTYALLIKGLAGRPWRMKAIVQEVLDRESSDFSPDLAVSVLHFCSTACDKSVADTLLERMKPTHFNVLTMFIRFYLETEQFHKACDVFEKYVQPLGQGETHRRFMMDSRVERSLMNAALNCGRTSVVQCLFESSRGDVAKHVIMIRKCASENNLKGAMSIFDTLKSSGTELNSIVYNTVLEVCVRCQNLPAAEDWMRQTREAGMVDTVSFNTLIKAHLVHKNLSKARELMEEMKEAGFQPNRVTYNEILNAVAVQCNRRSDIWEIVNEMKEASVPPNQVTCSILLKTLNGKSSETDVLAVMDLIASLDEPMDEVLLSSTVEACVRIGKPDLLARKLEDLQGKDRIAVSGSHTCGSLIKAYGHARDIEGVWRVWQDMRSRLIKPTSITVGCMVDAVVNNGDTERAFELIHEISQDGQCQDTVNSVIYCSLLKGFSREKKLDRVWDVYKDMSAKNMEMSLIAFNTIVDACARAGRMDELPKVLQDMKKHFVEPNLITYSTILKGHCHAGNIELAFKVLKDMKHDTQLKPDEIMYNSLLDGCAQNNLFEEGMSLMEEMQKEGIPPSNFTLSIMVKLLNRAYKVEQAFDLVRDITNKFKFKPNLHVYTNLIQGCIANRQPERSLAVLESMVKERVQPDSRTYAVLIRSSIIQHKPDQAAALFRAALGLPGAYTIPGLSLAACRPVDQKFVHEALANFVNYGHAQTFGAPLLADMRKSSVNVKIDQALQCRITSSVGDDSPPSSRISPKGKGRGQKSSW